MSAADDLQRWVAEQACRDVVVATAQAVDRQDYDALVALFTEDTQVVRPGGEPLLGRAALHAAYASRDPARLTRHLICNHQVQLQADGTAHSRCSVLLWTGRHTDTATPRGRPADAAQQVGYIEDSLRFTPEGWRIARRQAGFDLYRD